MTETKQTCPSCNILVDAILNPEGISGATINICSNCMNLLVVENNKIRKMTFKEVQTHYIYLKYEYSLNKLDDIFLKLSWVKRAMYRMRQELALLN